MRFILDYLEDKIRFILIGCRSPYEIRTPRCSCDNYEYLLPFSLWDSKENREPSLQKVFQTFVAVLLMRFSIRLFFFSIVPFPLPFSLWDSASTSKRVASKSRRGCRSPYEIQNGNEMPTVRTYTRVAVLLMRFLVNPVLNQWLTGVAVLLMRFSVWDTQKLEKIVLPFSLWDSQLHHPLIP